MGKYWNDFRISVREAVIYVATMLKWIAFAALVGVLGGVLGSVFHIGVEMVTEFRSEHMWLLYLLPVGGVLVALLYRIMKTEGESTNAVIEAVHSGREIPPRLLPAIFFGTILSHLFGASVGREGAALQIGGNLGIHVGKFLRLDDKDRRLATLCGMSALFSALFGTPLAASLFSLEVISVGTFYYAGLVPCIVAALVAFGVSVFFGIAPTRYIVAAPLFDGALLCRVAFLAVLCALLSIVFCKAMHISDHAAKHFFKNPLLRAAVGGAIIIVLTLLVGSYDYNGGGMNIIAASFNGEAKPFAFLWKILFTAVSLGFGFKGGEVVPTFFVGATFGCMMGSILGVPVGFAAAVGLVTVFCGAVNCPIASILLSVELFGAEGILYFALACAISYVLSGYCGLYSSQTILYSKLKAEFINVRTK